MNDLIIGSHVSFKKDKQLLGSVLEALSYGSNAFMIYTGAPQNTSRSPIDLDLVTSGQILMKEKGIDLKNVVVHAPYIVNLANNEKPSNYEFAINFLKQEIERCEQLGIDKIVLHPGSYVNLSKEAGIANIIAALNRVLKEEQKVTILLETMAGKGTEVGSKLEEVKAIIDGVTLRDKLGVCIDSCHLNDAGYKVADFEAVLDQIDHVIGLDKVKCVHINDSKNIEGSHKDRHENFGYGEIGFENLIAIIYNERLKNIPKILETPYVSAEDGGKDREYPPYKFEIEMIKSKTFNPDLHRQIREYYK